MLLPVAHSVQLVMCQEKFRICSFLCISFGNEQKLSKNYNFFTFGQKQCFYLEYFKKLPIKRNKNPKFKQLYLKNQGKFRVKTEIFWKFIQISPKEPSFLNTTHVDTWQGALSPTTCGATASSSQRSKSQSIFFDVF